MFELRQQKTFIVRTAVGPESAQVIIENYVSCIVCICEEFESGEGHMTVINADHVQVAVMGRFHEVVEMPGARYLG